MNEEKLKTQVSDNKGKCQLRHIKTRKYYITIQIDRYGHSKRKCLHEKAGHKTGYIYIIQLRKSSIYTPKLKSLENNLW